MNPHPQSPNSAAQAAAEWLSRHDRGLTALEQDQFLEWLQHDSRHRAEWERASAVWSELDALGAWEPAHSQTPNPDLLAKPRRSVPWQWATAVAASVLFIIAALSFVRTPAPGPEAIRTAFIAPDTFDQRALQDGSVIDLNRGTRVEVRYTPSERQVWLTQGEAHFTVAKDAARPFVVRAGPLDVRAIGTAFNIRLLEQGTEVLVTEGTVQVEGGTSTDPLPPLTAGERLFVDHAGRSEVKRVAADEMALSLAWQPRLLEFDATPLADVVAAFNRHNTVQLEIGDQTLSHLKIGASFRSNNIEGFVRLLEGSFGLTLERHGDRIVLRRALP